MANKNRVEDIKTGIFVMLAVVIFAVFLLNTIGKHWFATNRKHFTTYFHFVKGLELGAPVGFGGKMVGEVKSIEIATDEELKISNGKEIKVEFEIDGNVPVNSGSITELSTISLMSVVYVEVSAGNVKDKTKRLKTNSVIASKEMASMDSLMKTAGDVAIEAKGMIAKINKIINDIADKPTKEALKKAIQKTDDVMNEVNSTIADFHKLASEKNRDKIDGIISDIKDVTGNFKTKLDKTFKNIESLTGRLDRVTKENEKNINELFKNLKDGSLRLKELVAEFKGVTGENKENINKIISNFAKTTEKIDNSMTKIEKLLNNNSPKLDETIENIRVMTDNGVEMTEKIKRYPWKLIWKTGEKPIYDIKTFR